MNAMKIVSAIVLSATALFANELPDSPEPKTINGAPSAKTKKNDFNRRAFWVETVPLAGSWAADMYQTRRVIDRGGFELNPLYGRRPSSLRLTVVGGSLFAADLAMLYVANKTRRPWLRWLGRAYVGADIVEHTRLADCNASINVRSPEKQRCSPLPFLY